MDHWKNRVVGRMGQEKEMSRGFCQLNGWRLKTVLKVSGARKMKVCGRGGTEVTGRICSLEER